MFFDILRSWRKCWQGLDEQWDGNPAALEKVILNYIHGEIPSESESWQIQHSVSGNLHLLGMKELGEKQWKRELESMDHPAPVFLRVNSLKGRREEAIQILMENGIPALAAGEEGIRLEGRPRLDNLEIFKTGLIEIQDISSQEVVPFLDPRAGERILDVCAGGGGKTLHIASFTSNKSTIVASDASKVRLERMKERIIRSGATGIQLTDPGQIRGPFHRILIDAPCSGSGVIRREPVKKYVLDEALVDSCRRLQASLLDRSAALLLTGGVMVYAVCSIFPSEGTEMIRSFLSGHSGWVTEEEKMFFPSETEGDGFYMARIKKNS
ncbi:MAG: RsmB/NOP family class I SAM-dependent RNA methyltransferase [Bacteroidia bacterium]|nr:RsmB/NOP family class I SAM-dependent RNA methyltransferase [Bacteroidia bacterium]